MTNRWRPTREGQHLRARRNRDTRPEMTARHALHMAGFRFRLQVRLAPGCRPDILLPKHRVAVFCHGDFWHVCPMHPPRDPRGPNADLWRAKWSTNQRRDAVAEAICRQLGWTPVVLWECELRIDPDVAVRRVRAASIALHGPGDV